MHLIVVAVLIYLQNMHRQIDGEKKNKWMRRAYLCTRLPTKAYVQRRCRPRIMHQNDCCRVPQLRECERTEQKNVYQRSNNRQINQSNYFFLSSCVCSGEAPILLLLMHIVRQRTCKLMLMLYCALLKRTTSSRVSDAIDICMKISIFPRYAFFFALSSYNTIQCFKHASRDWSTMIVSQRLLKCRAQNICITTFFSLIQRSYCCRRNADSPPSTTASTTTINSGSSITSNMAALL